MSLSKKNTLRSMPILVLILLFLNTVISSGQNDSIVKVNRVKYQQIRNNKESYDQVKVDLTGETSVNTHATGFYEGNELKMIEVIYLIADGHRQLEYYFFQNNLFFVLERNQPQEEVIVINKNSKSNAGSKEELKENRYYFYKDKLIRWYDNEKKEIDVNSKVNSVKGEELISQSYKLKEKLKK